MPAPPVAMVNEWPALQPELLYMISVTAIESAAALRQSEVAINMTCSTACCLGQPLKERVAPLQHHLRCFVCTMTPSVLLHVQEQQPTSQEELLYSESVIAIDCAAALKQCETAISSCTACCLGLVLKEGTAQQHHYSTARGLSKAQLLELQKLKAGTSADDSHSQRSTWPCDVRCDACGHISQ